MSVSGNATGVRFGVATSTNRPATPFDGQVISETDTDRLVVYNGSAWGSYGGLQLVKTQTIGSGVSSVEVADAFSATYQNYLIKVTGTVASTATYINLKLGASAASYYNAVLYSAYDTDGANFNRNNNGTSFLYIGRAADSTNPTGFDVEIKQPFEAVFTQINNKASGVGTASSINIVGGGYHGVASSYSAFTISPATGTLTGGTIRVYGYLNS